MESTALTTWSLEQTAADDLTPATAPAAVAAGELTVVRAAIPSPGFNRYLYGAVGADVSWTDRLVWDEERWRTFVEQPGTETWVAYERGTPAGYLELEGQPEGVAEITYFGLLPAFRGRRIGGHLLSVGTARAWDLAERWPGRAPTRRVWVHTCSDDGPHALDNYRRRGFRIFDVRTEDSPAGGVQE
ncbi:GNAT family N-acetyltransferase [Streptomyces sp. B8F3]|uniref:GNAT family N-acetyltransferase n=1 Tax=unclassified Streptomyces TaxID=2593676 RepID=UPI00325E547C